MINCSPSRIRIVPLAIAFTLFCLAPFSNALGQYGGTWEDSPASTQSGGWDSRTVRTVSRGVYVATQDPGIRNGVKNGAKKAGKGVKAFFVAIGAAIVGFFKWLSDLFSGKKKQ